MRIERLDLSAFGPFTGAALDLSAGSQGLHLIYGPNEAGKTSALRAIKQLFCGFPHLSSDDFIHNNKTLRVGARIQGRSGEILEFVRRKGRANTLLGVGGAALEGGEERLIRLLGGVTAENFRRLFLIDREELMEGGKAVLAGQGDLGQLLFTGSGLTGVETVRKGLQEEAGSLYKPGGSKPSINELLGRLEAGRKQLRDGALKSSDWLAHSEALDGARGRKEKLQGDIDLANKERRRLSRVMEGVELVGRREALVEELATLAGAPVLAADFRDDRKDAQLKLGAGERDEARSRLRLGENTAAIEAIELPEGLLLEAEAIEVIHLRMGMQQQASLERTSVEAEHEQAEAEARAILMELGREPDVLWGNIDGLRLKTSDQATIHELAGSWQALIQGADEARKAIAKLAAKRAGAAVKLAAIGGERDPLALRKSLKQSQAQGDLESLIEKDRKDLAREERKAATERKGLGLGRLEEEEFEGLRVPAVEMVELFEEKFKGASAEHGDLVRKGDELEEQGRAAEAKLVELRLSGDIPTEGALAEARAARDAAWQKLKRVKGWEEGAGERFEALVEGADELADRLRREAQRVSEHARAFAEKGRLEGEREALAGRIERSKRVSETLRADWEKVWKGVGIDAPGTAKEMRAWLKKHGELEALMRANREARVGLGAREALAEGLRGALGVAMEAMGKGGASNGDTLAAIVERAEEAVEEAKKEGSARKRYMDELEMLDLEMAVLERNAEAANEEKGRWEKRWTEVMARIQEPGDALPSAALAVLERTARLFERIDQSRKHRRKLEEGALEAERFAGDVRTMAARVAADLLTSEGDEFDAEHLAAELEQRLKKARAAAGKRGSLMEHREEYEGNLRTAGETIVAMKGRLAALCREAGCEETGELPVLEERSERRQKREAELGELDKQIRTLAAGTALKRFLEEVKGADVDALPGEIQRLDETLETLGREREALDQSIGREGNELARMDGNSLNAEAGQEAENLRARVRVEVEQYARLRLALAVLRKGMERYREKAQGPVLNRASALFAKLTLGSFERLEVHMNDHDKPVLKGIRGGGGGAVGVEGMSLGTADQLYLAIRLATLETELERREPLPLVVDDVLIQFDNARAAATLEVLAELSNKTQVLVFTHHEHLLRLADEHVGKSRLFHHRLPESRGTRMAVTEV